MLVRCDKMVKIKESSPAVKCIIHETWPVHFTTPLMEVWFPRREYAVGQAPQGHSNDRICRHENDPGQSLIGKLRCVQYPIYMTSVFAKECDDHRLLSL